MNSSGSLGSSVVLVVSEFPSDAASLRCRHVEESSKCIQYVLLNGTKFTVYIPGTLTNLWYSNSGVYCKFIGDVQISSLKSVITFLKLYKHDKKMLKSCLFGISSRFKKLADGLHCENTEALQGALTNALAVKLWRLDPHFEKYRPLCEEQYLQAKCSYSKVLRRLRYGYFNEKFL